MLVPSARSDRSACRLGQLAREPRRGVLRARPGSQVHLQLGAAQAGGDLDAADVPALLERAQRRCDLRLGQAVVAQQPHCRGRDGQRAARASARSRARAGHSARSSRGGPGRTTTSGPASVGTTSPGAVPAGSRATAPRGTSACLRTAAASGGGRAPRAGKPRRCRRCVRASPRRGRGRRRRTRRPPPRSGRPRSAPVPLVTISALPAVAAHRSAASRSPAGRRPAAGARPRTPARSAPSPATDRWRPRSPP